MSFRRGYGLSFSKVKLKEQNEPFRQKILTYVVFRSEYASEFFNFQRDFLATHVHRYDSQPRVKIAVLDTGLDQENSEIRGLLSKERLNGHSSAIVEIVSFCGATTEDTDGHGTHNASLLIKVAPHADLYIAKIASTAHSGMDGLETVVEVSRTRTLLHSSQP